MIDHRIYLDKIEANHVDHVAYTLKFFFQAEVGIRDRNVTGVQTCALPIYAVLGDLGAQRVPVQRGRTVHLDVAAAVLGQQVDGVDRQDALVPQRALERRVAATFGGQRSEERRVGTEWRPRGSCCPARNKLD